VRPGNSFPAAGKSRAVRLIKEYLESRYSGGAKLAELVHLTQLDRAYLIRTFRGAVGMPPHRYLIQIRVRQAKRLIGAGPPLAEVAAETGFSDQSHLSRRFKSLTGLTPGRYVRSLSFKTAIECLARLVERSLPNCQFIILPRSILGECARP
jgi:AraC-like DNA-binding protein